MLFRSLLVRPYLERMTRSELFTVMNTGMATVAGSVLLAYVQMLGGGDFAGHLVTASLLSAPAGILIAKVLVPETEVAETAGVRGAAAPRESANLIDAASMGAVAGNELTIKAERPQTEFEKTATIHRRERPHGALGVESLGAALASVQPENAIVVDEAATSGLPWFLHSAGAPPHEVLGLTGGAIGQGLPCATGAALACPERPVIAFQADGSAAYTLQALWTQARESLDVTTVLCSNRSYRILQIELTHAGIAEPGPSARALTDLSRPPIDWVSLARGFGVPGVRAETDAQLQPHRPEHQASIGVFERDVDQCHSHVVEDWDLVATVVVPVRAGRGGLRQTEPHTVMMSVQIGRAHV